jgi:hypothetical protein
VKKRLRNRKEQTPAKKDKGVEDSDIGVEECNVESS